MTSGSLVVDTNVKKVQHPSGGVAKKLLVEDGARNMVGMDEGQLNQWRASIDTVRQNIGTKQSLVAERTSSIEAMISRTQQAEQVLTARIGTRIGDAIAFSASQTPN